MTDRFLELGGVQIPVTAALDLRQTYEAIGGAAIRRMMNGAGIRQVHWQKLKTTIAGQGWTPDGLAALDLAQALVLKCIAPRAVLSASNAIALPAARRTDAGFAPLGYAWVNGAQVPTAVTLASNTATLDPVAGAVQYEAWYWPQITVLADLQQQGDIAAADFSWTLTAEEV